LQYTHLSSTLNSISNSLNSASKQRSNQIPRDVLKDHDDLYYHHQFNDKDHHDDDRDHHLLKDQDFREDIQSVTYVLLCVTIVILRLVVTLLPGLSSSCCYLEEFSIKERRYVIKERFLIKERYVAHLIGVLLIFLLSNFRTVPMFYSDSAKEVADVCGACQSDIYLSTLVCSTCYVRECISRSCVPKYELSNINYFKIWSRIFIPDRQSVSR